MSRVDEAIIQLLSSGKKRYKDLKREIVETGICSNQTLSNHLKHLVKDGSIHKVILPNRNTVYSINPSFERKYTNIVEISKLTSLLDGLQDTIINEDLQIIEPETRNGNLTTFKLTDWILSVRNVSKNRPKIKYSFYSDKSSQDRLKYFLSFEEIASKFQKSILEEFGLFYENIPPIMEMVPDPLIHTKWDSSLMYAEQLGKKHDFAFLMYSYFDGISYNNLIKNALQRLSNLRKGKEDWIFFLDEIGLRVHYSWRAYYTEGELIQVLFSKIIDKISFEAIGKICFIGELFGWGAQEYDVLALDAAITSDILYKLNDRLSLMEFSHFSRKERIPYDLINNDDFIDMKYELLKKEEKSMFIKRGLEIVESWLDKYYEFDRGKNITLSTQYISSTVTHFLKSRDDDYETTLNKIKENISFYYEEINIEGLNDKIELSQYNQIFNFKYKIGKKILDLNDNPKVKEFKSFIYETKKREWLQQCLDIGIPIWTTIPFKELRFHFETIL